MTRLAPPLVAFALQRALLAAVALASGLSPLSASTYVRWDSGHYLRIAAAGYDAPIPCPPASGYPASAFCGLAGWFPGYPFLLRAVGGSAAAGALCSAFCQLLCLLLVWELLGRRHRTALAFAAFFPGNVYFAAVFPISLCAMAMLACLWLVLRGRFGGAALAAGIAAVSYSTGLLLGGAVAAWGLLQRRGRAFLVLAGAGLGFAAALFVFAREAGRWDAFFLVQRKYGIAPGLPFDALLARVKPLVNARCRTAATVTTAAQTLLCTALLLACLSRLRGASAQTRLVLACCLSFWLAPLVLGGNLSLYRAEALLLPASLLLPLFPSWLSRTLTAGAIVLSIPMAHFFFRSVLV